MCVLVSLLVRVKARGVQVYQCQENDSCSLDHVVSVLYDVFDNEYLDPKGEHYFLPTPDGRGGRPTLSYFDGQHKVIGIVTVYSLREGKSTILLSFNSLNPKANVSVVSYFGQGVQIYSFSGSVWLLHNVPLQLSPVPEQEVIGKHYFLAEVDENGGRPTCETFMPPSRVTAKVQQQVVVEADSIPWLPLLATSHKGGEYLLASVSYVQRFSTRGGKPPQSVNGAKIAYLYMSPYTAIYWFFEPDHVYSWN